MDAENVKKDPQKLILEGGETETSGDASMSENNDLEKKRTTHLPITNPVDKNIRERTKLEAIPGPSADISDSLISTECTKTTNLESGKQSRKMKNTTEVEKQKVVASLKNSKRKAAHPPTSDMVMDTIKALKKRNGATLEDINTYIEENYQVNMKVIKPHVNKFLKKAVDTEVLDKTDGVGSKEKYKIKKRKNVERNSQNLRQKKGKVSKKVGTKGKLAIKKTAGKNSSKK